MLGQSLASLVTPLWGDAYQTEEGPVAFAVAVATWVLGFLYNWRLKSAGLLGNLIVALSVAMTFVIGQMADRVVGQPTVGSRHPVFLYSAHLTQEHEDLHDA